MRVSGRRGRSCATDGKSVVFGQVARLVSVLPEGRGNSGDGIFGNVFIERAWLGARHQDALDCLVLVGTVQSRMCERRIEVSCIVALAQQQNLPSLTSP
jgi:hypothetical protein